MYPRRASRQVDATWPCGSTGMQPRLPRGPLGAATRCLSLSLVVFFFLTFCHFSKKKNPAMPAAVLRVTWRGPTQAWRGPTQAFPGPHTRTQNQDGPWPGPPSMESRLLGTEPGTERTTPFSKYIYMCVYRKNRTPSLALPRRPSPNPNTLLQKQPRKKVYKNILQEFFKVYSSLPALHRPAPPSTPTALSTGHLGPDPTLPKTHIHRQTDGRTDGRTALLLPLP